VHDRPVGEREDAVVQRAGDRPLAQIALVQRAAAVRAAVREREQLAALAHEHHRRAVGLGAARLPGRQLGVGQHVDPAAVAAVLERRLVDADAVREREMTAEIAAGGERSGAGECEQSSAAAAAARRQ
jgi:hypothetical protein